MEAMGVSMAMVPPAIIHISRWDFPLPSSYWDTPMTNGPSQTLHGGSLPITATAGGQLVDGDAKGSVAGKAHHGHLGVAHLALEVWKSGSVGSRSKRNTTLDLP